MTFNKIDVANWDRREYFEQFFKITPCTYSMTFNLDLTKLLPEIKKRGVKLNPTLIYLISKVVNNHKEFRTTFDANGNLGVFDQLHPCYTFLPENSDLFTNIWTEYNPEFSEFYRRYLLDIQNYREVHAFMAKPNCPANNFMISSFPMISFTGLNLNIPNAMDYLLPIFTIGKYFEQNGRIALPLAIQAHHAVCDGVHLGRFVNELQSLANASDW